MLTLSKVQTVSFCCGKQNNHYKNPISPFIAFNRTRICLKSFIQVVFSVDCKFLTLIFSALKRNAENKIAPPQNLKFGSKYELLSAGNYSCSCITYWFTRWNMVLKCKILRRLDLTSRLKIEYLAGHQTEIFFRKLYSNSIKRRCLYT